MSSERDVILHVTGVHLLLPIHLQVQPGSRCSQNAVW